MYFPYFRGKQFELIAVRETAPLIASSTFTPIIEPVRESLTGLSRALTSLESAGASAVVIVNPRHGDHRHGGEGIGALLQRDFSENDAIHPGLLLTSGMNLAVIERLSDEFRDQEIAFIHSGFTEARDLADLLRTRPAAWCHVFMNNSTNLLYRRHFTGRSRVLVNDGFVQMKNSAYEPVDSFSDLHVTFQELGMDGFGDFLTVGDNYSEGGGPAYAVAIHLTFIDPRQEDAMFIYHFKSDTNDTPVDPAGKFSQALEKFVEIYNAGNSNLYATSAVEELLELHARGHFPGLGYIKKLSMKHHLETLAQFQAGQQGG